MHIGHVVGISIAIALIICGIAALLYSTIRRKAYRWPKWLILGGIVALVSAFVNFYLLL